MEDETWFLEVCPGWGLGVSSRELLDAAFGKREALEALGTIVVEEKAERDPNEPGVLHLSRSLIPPQPLEFVSFRFSL